MLLHHSIHLAMALVLLSALGCDDLDSEDADLDDVAEYGQPQQQQQALAPPRQLFPVGSLWGRCDLADVDDPDWWGCNGTLGEGLACLRPVSDNGLNICVPQTWDPNYDDDCGNVYAPFGDPAALGGSTYCVVECSENADCGVPGMACSPASHFCAWIGE